MTTAKAISANNFGTCALLTGSSTPAPGGTTAKHSCEIRRITASMHLADGSTINGQGFYLYTPQGAYLGPPDYGGLGGAPTGFRPGLVVNRAYSLPEATGYGGQTVNPVPVSPFTPPLILHKTTQSTSTHAKGPFWDLTSSGGSLIASNIRFAYDGLDAQLAWAQETTLWDSTDPPLRLGPDQVIAVQPTFAPNSGGWSLFTTWWFRELTTEGL